MDGGAKRTTGRTRAMAWALLALIGAGVLVPPATRAEDGEQTLPHVDTPLGELVDGSIWTVHLRSTRGDEEMLEPGLSTAVVVLRQKRTAGTSSARFNYALKMTCGGTTRYQWHGGMPYENHERALSGQYFGRLAFPGLTPGGEYPYRIEIKTSHGLRFVKEGTLKVSPEWPQLAPKNLERALEKVNTTRAKLEQAKPDTYAQFDATVRYHSAKLEAAEARVVYGGEKPEAVWADVRESMALLPVVRDWPKPGDRRDTDEQWRTKTDSYLRMRVSALESAASRIMCAQSVALLRDLDPWVERYRTTNIRGAVWATMGMIHYSLTGQAGPTVAHLERAHELYEQAERESAAKSKREPQPRELARQILPTDFEPITLSRNQVQAKLCALVEEVFWLTRDMEAATDFGVNARLKEKIAQRQQEAARLRELLASIPGPTDTSRFTTFNRVRQRIAGSYDLTVPEQLEARRIALDTFDDMLFVERDRSVHGNIKKAFVTAMPEVAPDRRVPGLTIGQFVKYVGDTDEQLLKAIQLYAEHDPNAGALKRLRAVHEANERIAALHRAALHLKATDQDHLRQLPEMLDEILKLAEHGPLSRENLAATLEHIRALPAGEAEKLKDGIAAVEALQSVQRGKGWAGTVARLRERMRYLKALGADDMARIWTTVSETAAATRNWDLGPFDKLALGASAMQSVGMFIEGTKDADEWLDYMEPGGRALAPFIVDLIFTGVPLAGLADMAVEVISVGVTYAVHGEAGKYNLSDMAKDIFTVAMDADAAVAGAGGELFAYLWDQQMQPNALEQIDPDEARRYLARVECRLSSMDTALYDDPDFATRSADGRRAAQLLRARRVFRMLLRGHEEAGLDPWTVVINRDHGYTLFHPPAWKLTDRSNREAGLTIQRVTMAGYEPDVDHVGVEVLTFPQEMLNKMGRKLELQDPQKWWAEGYGSADVPGLEVKQPASRSQWRGRPINSVELVFIEPGSKKKVWICEYELVHRRQVLKLRAICEFDSLNRHRKPLMDVLNRVRLD